VKTKYLFLLKLLGYSFLLFLIGHQFLRGYASSLTDSLNVFDPRYRIPPNIEQFLYRSSLTVIAFLSLIFSTPKIPILRKAAYLSIGVLVFFFTDFFFIQHIKGKFSLNEDSLVFEMYFCIKWLLPFLLWIIVSYPYLGELFSPGKKVSEGTVAGCPSRNDP
jgi:hypothetical protein